MKNTKLTMRGFTLLEVLIALAIGSVLMASVLGIFKNQVDSNSYQKETVVVEQNLRGAMEILTGELQMAGFNLAGQAKPFDTGDLTLVYTEGSPATKKNMTVKSDGDAGAPDSLFLRMTAELPLNIVKYPGASILFTVCAPSGLTRGQTLFTANASYSEQRVFQLEDKSNTISVITCAECPNPPNNCEDIQFDKAGFDPSDDINDFFENGTVYTLISRAFYIMDDFDGDAATVDPALIMIDNEGARTPLAFGINDMQIEYILNDGSVTTAPADTVDVRRVSVTLSGITPHRHKIGFGGTASHRSKTLSTTVQLHNLGLL